MPFEYEIAVNNTAVYADGGTIQDNFKREKVVTSLKRNNIWSSCVGLWVGAHKVDGNQLVSKGYDVKMLTNLEQLTGAKQPTYNNGSLLYNGSNKLVSNSSPTNYINNLTVGIWVFLPNNASEFIMCRYDIGQGQTDVFLMSHTATGLFRVSLLDNSTKFVAKTYDSTNSITGGWRFISFTFSSNSLKLQINGIEETTTKVLDNACVALNAGTQKLSIGGRAESDLSMLSNTSRTGLAIMLNATLTNDQLLAFYNNTKGIYGL